MSGTVSNSSTPKAALPFYIDQGKRYVLTAENMTELGLTWEWLSPLIIDIIGKRKESDFSRWTQEKKDKKAERILPDGISINGVRFGDYPKSTPTAAELGWITYMVVGEPLVEEKSNIIQPAADLLSTRSYTNRGDSATDFEDSVKFSISNTINWSLQGSSTLTFGGRATGTVQGQMQKSEQYSFESSAEVKHISHNHKDNIGIQDETSGRETKSLSETTTGTGTATGTGEVFSQLALGVVGSTSGSLTSSWESNSSVSGKIPPESRVETMATQRRQIKEFTYELPVTLSGFISLHYPKPVLVETNYIPPQDPPSSKDKEKRESEKYSNTIAYDVFYIKIYGDGEERFFKKGIAETVSALQVEHTIFKADSLSGETYPLTLKRPHNM